MGASSGIRAYIYEICKIIGIGAAAFLGGTGRFEFGIHVAMFAILWPSLSGSL
jgi:hypothetical protein